MVRDTVREYQRRLVQLDAEHLRAQDRLAAAKQKRDDLIAEQNELVSAAEREVGAAVTAMASALGPDVTASILDMKPSELRRLLRSTSPKAGGARRSVS